ncbi:MAG TPA: septation protein IspZ [Steroidobacteraceae bacterium]|jgi:intracellular septation protein|nr:septation protein IspZ [Steroidobacteraceae bacterium]HNS27967.1 septation protein IspZ [Steroidobacteraceae bacterium]
MQQILDFAPLVVFLVAYYLKGMYFATAALMIAMLLLLVADKLLLGRVPTMHWVSAVLVLLFGAATLLLQDQRFIQWKPTIFFWLVSVALLGSRWIGERPLVERMLAPALGADARLPRETWQRINLLWVGFYAALGVLNIAVAFNAPERTWVNFKVFGLTALTFVFIVAQLPWILKRAHPA